MLSARSGIIEPVVVVILTHLLVSLAFETMLCPLRSYVSRMFPEMPNCVFAAAVTTSDIRYARIVAIYF